MKRDEAVVSVGTLWVCAGHQSGREGRGKKIISDIFMTETSRLALYVDT